MAKKRRNFLSGGRIEGLVQQTEDWRKWRKLKIGGSDAPIIMKDSPYSTPYQLWQDKCGLVTRVFTNYAIDIGNQFEPVARALYELETGLELPADIKVHPRYDFIMASLDGYSKDAGVCLEIKIAGREVIESAKKGIVHQKYYAQVQHQLEVTGAKENHFYVCTTEKITGNHAPIVRINDSALVIAKRDEAYIERMLKAELEFYRFVKEKIPPPLEAADVVTIDAEEGLALFKGLLEAKQSGKGFDEMKREAIEYVEEIVKHTAAEGCGVRVSKDKRGVWSVKLVA